MKSLFAAIALSSLVTISTAAAATVTVNGQSGPWDVSLNPGYSYGQFANGQNNFNLPPTVVGLGSESALTITSLTPGQNTLLAGAGGTLWSDANGVPSWGPATTGSPGAYIPVTVYLEELVGTFADNGVIVGTPFAIGNGPTTVTVPAGANELLMGVVDGWYNDNGGSVQVNISSVPEACSTMALLGAALSGLAVIRRRMAR